MDNKHKTKIVKLKVKVKKFKLKKFLFFLLFIILISTIIFYLNSIKIKNITITGNNVLSDQLIIETVGLENYPKFTSIRKTNVKNKLLENPIISNVTIKKNIFTSQITINVTENELLFEEGDYIVMSSNEKIPKENYITPKLMNFIEEPYYTQFIEKYNTIDKDITALISQIKYIPNKADEERFLLIMTDGNQIYMTLSRVDKVNKYLELKAKVGGSKGSFHLDTGIYFEKGKI